MRFKLKKVKAFFIKIHYKSILIGLTSGCLFSIIMIRYFIQNIEQNFHFEGKSNWVQFYTDSTLTNESFISLPNFKLNGLEAFANGDFSTVLMLKNSTLNFDSISKFSDMGDSSYYLEGLQQFGTLELNEYNPKFITPILLSFDRKGSSYFRNDGLIKNFSKDKNNRFKENNSIECNADFSFKIPVNEIVTVKCVKSDIENCLLKELPSEFFINNPLDYRFKLFNKFLPIDSCKTLLLSHTYKYPKVNLGTNELNTIINGGKVKIKNITFEGDFNIKAQLAENCNKINLSKNEKRPFDIAISMENFPNNNSYFCLVSSVSYIFIMSPEGIFNLGNNQYKINRIDKLEMSGDLYLSIIYNGNLLPDVSIEGNISSCKLNSIELLKTRWGSLASDVKGGIIGGIVGFLLSLLTIYFKKISKPEKN